VTAGSIVFGVAYGLGAFGALVGGAPSFSNQSGWMLAPVVGPWITLARRRNVGPCSTNIECESDFGGADAVHDALAQFLIVFDGLAQGTGAALLIAGYASAQPWQVPNTEKIVVRPVHIGNGGYGAAMSGSF
jgi:hypothetical protein